VRPIVFSYEIRGHGEALRATRTIVEALRRGDGAPVVPGADMIGQARAVHGHREQLEGFPEKARRLYGRH
jgi:hypothetical protein